MAPEMARDKRCSSPSKYLGFEEQVAEVVGYFPVRQLLPVHHYSFFRQLKTNWFKNDNKRALLF